MIKKWHANLTFKWFDLWIGLFLDRPGNALYICFLPMLPFKIWFTEHKHCPMCGGPMQKTAFDCGDWWDLEWRCEEDDYATEGEIEWPFGEEKLSAMQLELRGYKVL
jgi:hypothetical protein